MKTSHRRAAQAKRTSRWQADASAPLMLLQAAAPMPPSTALQLGNQLAIHWERLRTGVGDANDWRYLAVVANICMIRAERIAPELEQLCDTAMQSLIRMAERGNSPGGTWGVDHTSLAAIPPLMELHDELMRTSTPLQMHNASLEAERRTQRRHVVAVGNFLGRNSTSPA